MTDQVINCFIKIRGSNLQFYCSFVYGHVKAPKRKPLWKDLQKFSLFVNKDPWIVVGDFNAVLRPSEVSIGSSQVTSSMTDLADCCEFCGLEDLPSSGFTFTWNKSP